MICLAHSQEMPGCDHQGEKMETLQAQAKLTLEHEHGRILRTFAAVPDDKLSWSPSATSKSALQIVVHCGFTNQFLASAIKGDQTPPAGSVEERHAAMDKKIAAIKTREEAISLLADSVLAVSAALDGVSADALGSVVQLPFGAMPMAQVIWIPARHITMHAAQIDYIETMWGDLSSHM
jgi:hypothetical protein